MNDAIKRWGFVITILLCTMVFLTACERVLYGSEKAAVLAYSEPATDNLLAGLTANDYAAFSRDFDIDMQEEIPASDFAELFDDLENKFGKYLSREIDQVTQSDEFRVVTYQAEFDKVGQVLVSVVFHARKPHTIAFLAFDAENASWSTFQ